MQPVYLRIVRDDGKEFAIDNERWLVPNDGLENWAELPYSVSTEESAQYDGGVVTNRRVSVVDRSVTAELADWRENAKARAEVISFFSPKHEYEAHLTYQGRTRWCGGVQYAFKCSVGNVYEPCSFTWTILCPQPFLLSEDDYGKDIAAVEPKFGFPFMSALDRVGSGSELAHQRGFQAGVRVEGKTASLDNDGDLEAWPRFVITAGGQVVNPVVSVKTDITDTSYSYAYIQIWTTLEAGDVLVVDTESRPPSVTVNGANANNLVDHLAEFTGMRLGLGTSKVSYSATEGDAFMSVYIYYRKRYLGI